MITKGSSPAGCTCPICDRPSRLVTTLEAKEYERYDICCCPCCHLAFVGSLIGTDRAYSCYDEKFYDSPAMCAATNPIRETMERSVVFAQLRMLANVIEVPGRILDVGCGDGVHLKLFREAGWEVHGTEVSAFASQHVEAEYGIKVWIGDLRDAPFEAGQFDVIQMRHVIEHLTDIVPTISKAQKLLRPGGVICIDTPNRGLVSILQPVVDSALSPLADVWRTVLNKPGRQLQEPCTHWGNLHPPEHNFWFTAKAMRSLLKSVGFSSMWIRTTYRGHPEHYPSKSRLQGQRQNWWDRAWFFMDILSSMLGAGGVLIAYAQK